MKLESQLPRQSPWLYLAPLLTTILLLLVYFLLSSGFVVRTGVSVRPPDANSRLVGFDTAHIITIAPGNTPRLFLDGQPVLLDELAEQLRSLESSDRSALIHADRQIPFGQVVEVANVAWEEGFTIAYSTTQVQGTELNP